jgi:hypothetical protein
MGFCLTDCNVTTTYCYTYGDKSFDIRIVANSDEQTVAWYVDVDGHTVRNGASFAISDALDEAKQEAAEYFAE